MTMLQVKGLSFFVGSAKRRSAIFKDLNFTIKTGEFVIITGPNGSGKSSLAKLISGINKATSGQILFDGADITTKTITERARLGIAFAFQQPPHFKGLTVDDMLRIAATSHEELGQTTTDYKRLIETVGLDEKYLERGIDNTLSGGEIKRIEIASVLARQAKLTIFDEPEAGIDIWSFEKLVQVFKKLRKKAPEHSLVIISHQKRLIEQADRVIVLERGRIVLDDSPNKILPKLREKAL